MLLIVARSKAGVLPGILGVTAQYPIFDFVLFVSVKDLLSGSTFGASSPALLRPSAKPKSLSVESVCSGAAEQSNSFLLCFRDLKTVFTV